MDTTHENKELNLVVGGIQNHLLELLPIYEKNEDLTITLITKYSKYKPLTDRVKINIIQKFQNSKISTIYFFLKSFKNLIQIHKKDPINVINIHSYYYDIISPLLMHYIFKIPLLITTPTGFTTAQKEEFISKPQSLFYRIAYYAWMDFFTKIVRRSKKVCIQAINSEIYKDLIKFRFSEDNLIIIPNGIASQGYLGLKKEEHENIHYGFLGRLIKSKNIRFLLNVFSKYIAKYPEDKLFIFGKGPEEEYIRNFILKHNLDKNIKFWGFLKSKLDIYKKLDVLIHPSLGEGFPMTLLEAILTNTFVIASDVSGSQEIIEHKINGLKFNPFNESDLIEQLNYFKNNQNLLPDMLKAAKTKVISDYSIETEVEKLIKFLRSRI